MRYSDPARPRNGIGGHPCYVDYYGNPNGEIHFPSINLTHKDEDNYYWCMIFHLPTRDNFTSTQRILDMLKGVIEEYLIAFEANPEAFLYAHFQYQVPTVEKQSVAPKKLQKVTLEEL